MSYRNQDGDEIAVRFRLALTGPDRFRWRKGSKPVPYGPLATRRGLGEQGTSFW